LALRELATLFSSNADKISPIIEPVKASATLSKTLEILRDDNINFNIIINPTNGELVSKSDNILSLLSLILSDYDNFQIGILVDKNTNPQHITKLINDSDLNPNGITLIHNAVFEDVDGIMKSYEKCLPITNNVINYDYTSSNRRYDRNFNPSTRVSLSDYFNLQTKNADYAKIPISEFSDEYLHYKSEGFKGFGDYLTIGNNYSNSGFLPYAVAIHISYNEDNKILIRHFVSDSNDDSSDVGGKFAEANDKLVKWCKSMRLSTTGLEGFYALYDSGHFPGLGTIKKYSIMNHIELMLKLI
jgi:hypothetical protein